MTERQDKECILLQDFWFICEKLENKDREGEIVVVFREDGTNWPYLFGCDPGVSSDRPSQSAQILFRQNWKIPCIYPGFHFGR